MFRCRKGKKNCITDASHVLLIKARVFAGFFYWPQGRATGFGDLHIFNLEELKIMKNLLSIGITILALMVMFSGFSQRKPRIKGNRSVVSVEKSLPSFSHLILSEEFELHLQQGAGPAVRIEADDNLVDILRFEVDGDTLRVDSFYRITSSKKLGLILVYNEIESIRVEAGRLISEVPVVGDRLNLSLVGAGKAELNIRAALLDLEMVENTWADLTVETDSLHATFRGFTDTHIYTSGGAIDLSMTDQASLDLEGVSTELTASLTDNSRLKASGLQADVATALLNTSANARIQAITELAYEGRGSARLFVYGQPQIRILGLFDSAELHKVPD